MIGGTVKVHNVKKFFGSVQVLKDISLEIKAGEFFFSFRPFRLRKKRLY